MNNLIPHVSTHLRVTKNYGDITIGKSYEILEWKGPSMSALYSFRDDSGDIRIWYFYPNDSYVFDSSFSVNLEKILE